LLPVAEIVLGAEAEGVVSDTVARFDARLAKLGLKA
jgi:hypothetical protein